MDFKTKSSLSTINSEHRTVGQKYDDRSINSDDNLKRTIETIGNKPSSSNSSSAINQQNSKGVIPFGRMDSPEVNSNFAQNSFEDNQSNKLSQRQTGNARVANNVSAQESINALNTKIINKPSPNQFNNTDAALVELSNEDESTEQPSDDPLESEPQIIIAGDISGKVIDDDGVAVANVIVTATPFDVAEGQDSTARQRLTTQTNSEGVYTFNNVATASYKICNTTTNNITRTCIQRLPPQKTADLKVRNLNRPIRVSGQVTDQNGSPIEGVRVQLSVQNSVKDNTTSDGRYSIETTISKDENPTIYFQHANYSRSTARINTNQTTEDNSYQIDTQLNLIEGFTVTGRVVDEQGEPVAGQNIGIRDSNNRGGSRRYARSDSSGKVSIPHITAGEAYSPVVIPSAEFTYKVPDPKITFDVFDNSASFEVIVTRKQLTYSELRLYINNQAQLPVTGVSFTLTSAGKTIGKTKTDENGELLFNNVPENNLSLNSSVLPLNVSRIKRDRNNGATITADTGENDIIINITGKDSEPVFCKNASIRWFISQNGMRIQSTKTLAVDQNGRVQGSKFGAGEHQLNLTQCTSTTTETPHRNKTQAINIGSQIVFNVVIDPV